MTSGASAESLSQALTGKSAVSVAEMMRLASGERRYAMADSLDDRRLAKVLEELSEKDQIEILETLEAERVASVLEVMSPGTDDGFAIRILIYLGLISGVPAHFRRHGAGRRAERLTASLVIAATRRLPRAEQARYAEEWKRDLEEISSMRARVRWAIGIRLSVRSITRAARQRPRAKQPV